MENSANRTTETKKRKGTITEKDVSLILQRYSARAIVALLQEISQLSSEKIDWNAVAKRTSTGISCPRECQMMWRHLAYRDPLMEKIEDGAEPLDDDSDLEFELEAFPAVCGVASAEAAASVKVLMSSGSPNDSAATDRPTIEAPVIINTPNGSTCGLNIAIPVSAGRQLLSAEGLKGNGPSSSRPLAKKRRKWTKAEDVELYAAVDKHGEGNWQNILKENFTHDRTAAQLSQRWSTLKKQKQLSKSNAGSDSNPINPTTLTDAQLNTRQALSRALNMPMICGLSEMGSGSMQSSNPSGSVFPTAASEATPHFAEKAPNQSQQVLQQSTSLKGSMPTSNKSRITQTKPPGPGKPSTGSNFQIKKAAVAAGGRIANPSDAASFLKAAHSKNAVHIGPGGVLPLTQVSVGKPSPSATAVASHPSNTGQTQMLPPGVAPSSSGPESQQATCSSGKSSSQMPTGTTALSQPFSQQLSGYSKSAFPLCDNTGAKALPANAISILSKGDVEVAEQMKDNGSTGQNQVIVTEQSKFDSSRVQGQASLAEQIGSDSAGQEDGVAVLDMDVDEGASETMLDRVMGIQASKDENVRMRTSVTMERDQRAMVNLDVGKNSNPMAHQAANDQSLTDQCLQMRPDQNLVAMPAVNIGENTDSGRTLC